MSFKEYLNESLIVEAKVKVGGKEFSSKKDAGLFLAGQGKTADQIERMTGISASGALWCIAQSKKGDNKPKDKEPVKTQNQKTTTLDKLKTELKRAEDELKKLGKRGGSENDAYVLTLKKKIKDIEGSTKKEVKEPVKNKAQERREILDAYKKGEKYKPEPLELASLDKEKSRIKAKDWMKKHVDDHSKKKDLKDTSKADIKDASRADTRKKDLDEFKKMLKKEDELESAARKEDSDTLWDELDDLRSRIHKKGKEIFNKYNIDYRDFHGDNFQYVK